MQNSSSPDNTREVQTTPEQMYSEVGKNEMISNIKEVGNSTLYTGVEVLPDGGLMLSNEYGNAYISKNVQIIVTLKKMNVKYFDIGKYLGSNSELIYRKPRKERVR